MKRHIAARSILHRLKLRRCGIRGAHPGYKFVPQRCLIPISSLAPEHDSPLRQCVLLGFTRSGLLGKCAGAFEAHGEPRQPAAHACANCSYLPRSHLPQHKFAHLRAVPVARTHVPHATRDFAQQDSTLQRQTAALPATCP